MKTRKLFGGRRAALKVACAGLCVAGAALVSAGWRGAHAPRAWQPGEVPVAFWSWRSEAPSEEEWARARGETGARVLFLRAGQLDWAAGRVRRIRAFEGRPPAGGELHFVYNATPALLAGFEKIDEKELAGAVVKAFTVDAARGGARVKVSGLQLDLDVPTRLLPRYARVLREVRALMPRGVRLSLTGLPTWMDSSALREVLDVADFWAPQFYGAEIPATVGRIVPISSPASVARDVARARELGEPFYAGLAAYGYALHYDGKGKLLALRGDLDPARVAGGRDFELIERRRFGRGESGGAAQPEARWRYVFRARADAVLDETVVREGEQLVLDVPSAASLRAGVRAVRESAGERLLGVCLFRLPARGEPSTLSLAQVTAALADREVRASVRLAADVTADRFVLTAANDGEAGAVFGDNALTITLRVPRGSVRGVARLDGFTSFETLCEQGGGLLPCGAARAGVVRLRARSWPAGAQAAAALSFEGDAPGALAATVLMSADDGRAWEQAGRVEIGGGR